MKLYSCQTCNNQLYFESLGCTRCGSPLGFSEERLALLTLKESGTNIVTALHAGGATFRYCASRERGGCNHLIPSELSATYCGACSLTSKVADLSESGALAAWIDLERAKRRLLFSLRSLGLPVKSKQASQDGLAFEFLMGSVERPVMTGHANGVITINMAEADGAYRENQKEMLGEAYRTTLGHLRHEVGHYFFDRLVAPSDKIEPFRQLFGDERADYKASIARHYDKGPPQGFSETHLSGYATMHPWEDWAETWAHYLHMISTMETARSYGVSVHSPVINGSRQTMDATDADPCDFDSLMNSWFPVTLAINGLNRSMGQPDAYPFAISPTVREKLRFVHEVVHGAVAARPDRQRQTQAQAQAQG